MDPGEAFKRAWATFGSECSGTVAPEATYQAWFAHFLMEEFDVKQVVREVDFGARYLVDGQGRQVIPGSNVFLDVMVLRDPVVTLPRRTFLSPRDPSYGDVSEESGARPLRSGLQRLNDFLIISELKVGSTQGEGLSYAEVVDDVRKLDAILHSAHTLTPPIALPAAFACVLNNHSKRPLKPDVLEAKIRTAVPGTEVEALVFPPAPK